MNHQIKILRKILKTCAEEKVPQTAYIYSNSEGPISYQVNWEKFRGKESSLYFNANGDCIGGGED